MRAIANGPPGEWATALMPLRRLVPGASGIMRIPRSRAAPVAFSPLLSTECQLVTLVRIEVIPDIGVNVPVPRRARRALSELAPLNATPAALHSTSPSPTVSPVCGFGACVAYSVALTARASTDRAAMAITNGAVSGKNRATTPATTSTTSRISLRSHSIAAQSPPYMR